MKKIILKLLLNDRKETHVLRDGRGNIRFVGTIRQIRRRIKAMVGAGPLPWLLLEMQRRGFSIEKSILKNVASAYNAYMETIRKKLKDIPKEPGVYQFLDKAGEVLYVGKAKNLRSRVSQYLGGKDERPQLPYLMAEAADVNYTVVNNELESLFLENTLIKQYMPKYNIQLRDDKNYAFIVINYSTEIPQIEIARKVENNPAVNLTSKILHQKSRYFGPYSAAWKIRNTLNMVRRIFPYCAAEKVSSRPCFYYYLHRCPGVCVGKISLEEYQQQIDRICNFLSGNTSKIISELKTEMKIASSQQQFEKAARLRDQLQSLELLEERQTVILPRPVSWDIVSIAQDQGFACINLFKVRNGKLYDKENFIYELSDVDLRMVSGTAESYGTSAQQKFLERYYLDASNVPKEIYVQLQPENTEAVEQLLESRFSKKIKIHVPQRGKTQELIKLGQTNAGEHLKNWLMSQAGHLDKINEALAGLKEALQLEKTPDRIECYDISNIQGTNPVGSMVVFEKGLPKKSEYRKFKIRTKSTPDDFAMMKEMLTRRLGRLPKDKIQISNDKLSPFAPAFAQGYGGQSKASGDLRQINSEVRNSEITSTAPSEKTQWPGPDLIVIDGGKGQLSAALDALQKFQIFPLRSCLRARLRRTKQGFGRPSANSSSALDASEKNEFQIPIIGLAKRIEEVFLPGQGEPIVLSHDHPSLQLLQRIRDEAHRFGITFHRDLRSKQAVRSALDDIPGVGPKTKKLLKQKFGTIAQIKKASYEELAAVVGESLARVIRERL